MRLLHIYIRCIKSFIYMLKSQSEVIKSIHSYWHLVVFALLKASHIYRHCEKVVKTCAINLKSLNNRIKSSEIVPKISIHDNLKHKLIKHSEKH